MPKIGIIGGSGLYNMPALHHRHEVTALTPWGAPSDAIMIGEIAGRDVAFLARHGRGHRINPSDLPFRANIYALKELGVEWVLSFSAVGSRLRSSCTGLSSNGATSTNGSRW